MIAIGILILVLAALVIVIKGVTLVRGAGFGFEVGPSLFEGPYLFRDITAIATMTPSLVGDISHPSFLEVSIDGGGDNTGDVIVAGIINGAAFSETFSFAGPGSGKLTVKGALLFTSVTAVTTTGLDAEGPVPTVTVRVSDRTFINYMDEGMGGDQAIIDDSGTVSDRHSTAHTTGIYDLGGDISFRLGPENGLGEFLTATYGLPTRGDVDGPVFTVTEVFSQPRQVILRATGIVGSDDVTISGDVNGSPDTEDVFVDANGDFVSLKFFDEVTSVVVGAGITAGAVASHEAISYEYKWIPCDVIDPFFIRFAKELYERELQGLKMGKFELGSSSNDWVVGTGSAKGRTELINTIAPRTKSPLINFSFHQGVFTRNAASFPLAMEMGLSEENSLKDRPTHDGTRLMNDRTLEGGKSDLTMKLKFSGQSEYERFLGTVGDLEPQKVLTPAAFVFAFTSHELTFTAGPAYSLSINCPRAIIRKFTEPVKARDAMESDLDIYLEKDATLDATHEISLVSTIPAY